MINETSVVGGRGKGERLLVPLAVIYKKTSTAIVA